ncbi:DegT/DnrJ/EryC1/StrS family aminotransferase [Actinosynnema pretiosum]|uniref:Aminotransferase DegT n=1 Tax=Actinosynnema pretiosum TaxID=42197 RepID=A0A290Z813_9PSEU|nr:DegT/DnrJ/EryC1/StrS family aminotransferase [Actinosynnema pretiosum]ATE55148.1 aminotransferase DegT [Actinosynnema pretiosum]
MTATVPLLPTDLFDDDREVLLGLLHEVATDPEQKFVLGWRTAALERAIRDSVGAADAVACGSGTSALVLALKAFGVGPGDEVVVPAYGGAPLAAAPVLLGATPVFADVDPRSLVVDPAEVESLITGRTRAVVPAHALSTMADMPALRRIATTAGVRLLEDSAAAQGGVLGGRAAGAWGDAGVYSFAQAEAFGMPGEGGVVVTGDPALGRAVRVLRDHGQDGVRRSVHRTVGWNSRFDEVMAAFQLHRLPGLPERLDRAARIGDYYAERFAHLPPLGITPPPPGRDGRCPSAYSLLAERRDELRDHLLANGVGCHAHHPAPLPHQPAFAPHADRRRDWPNARRGCERSLAIPINPRLTDAQVEHVADQVCRFAERPR